MENVAIWRISTAPVVCSIRKIIAKRQSWLLLDSSKWSLRHFAGRVYIPKRFDECRSATFNRQYHQAFMAHIANTGTTTGNRRVENGRAGYAMPHSCVFNCVGADVKPGAEFHGIDNLLRVPFCKWYGAFGEVSGSHCHSPASISFSSSFDLSAVQVESCCLLVNSMA